MMMSEKYIVRVAELNVRSSRGLSSQVVGVKYAGETLQAIGEPVWSGQYRWIEHGAGWSAVQHLPTGAWLAEPDESPDRAQFESMDRILSQFPFPLESPDTQYYGNTRFAMWNGHAFNYCGYAQCFHAGLDLFAPAGTDVRTMQAGTVTEQFYAGSRNREQVWIELGDFVFIYQHLSVSNGINRGDALPAGTVIGKLHELGGNSHLHFEVRFKREWIANPFWLMTTAMADEHYRIYPPDTPADPSIRGSELEHFYKLGGAVRWLTPENQPVIRIGGHSLRQW